MKIFTCFILLAFSLSAGEWIEPPARSAKGYLVPTPDYNPVWPKDHGAHREYGLEWWYWVGHLETVSGEQKYGFQSTVFRVAGDPQNSKANTDDAFGNKQLFLAHAALSDLSNKKYIHHERVEKPRCLRVIHVWVDSSKIENNPSNNPANATASPIKLRALVA